MILQPLFLHLGAVGYDRNRLKPEVYLAELAKHSKLLRIQERLTTGEVDLLHASILQESETTLHVFVRSHMAGLLGVEAEAADLVAFACEVIVDRDRLDGVVLGSEFACHKDDEGASCADCDGPSAASREYHGNETHDKVELIGNKCDKMQEEKTRW